MSKNLSWAACLSLSIILFGCAVSRTAGTQAPGVTYRVTIMTSPGQDSGQLLSAVNAIPGLTACTEIEPPLAGAPFSNPRRYTFELHSKGALEQLKHQVEVSGTGVFRLDIEEVNE